MRDISSSNQHKKQSKKAFMSTESQESKLIKTQKTENAVFYRT